VPARAVLLVGTGSRRQRGCAAGRAHGWCCEGSAGSAPGSREMAPATGLCQHAFPPKQGYQVPARLSGNRHAPSGPTGPAQRRHKAVPPGSRRNRRAGRSRREQHGRSTSLRGRAASFRVTSLPHRQPETAGRRESAIPWCSASIDSTALCHQKDSRGKGSSLLPILNSPEPG